MMHYQQRIAELQDVARDLGRALEIYAGCLSDIAVALELDPEDASIDDIVTRCSELMQQWKQLELTPSTITSTTTTTRNP